jgi:hypothetical protein
MHEMVLKGTTQRLDARDLRILERLAKMETQRTGSRVSASAIVRRLIREFLLSQSVCAEDAIRRKARWGGSSNEYGQARVLSESA